MTRKPLRHINSNLFHSATRSYNGAALTSISSAWMVDEYFVQPKELEFLQYEENVVYLYEELVQSQVLSEDVSMNYARSEGVNNEWEMYNFFSQENVNAPTEVFEYVDNDGKIVYFTEEEQQQIQEWTSNNPYPIEGIQGHHMETIKENPTDQALAADPDNILFATSKGHLTHLHGGSTQNPTNEIYSSLSTSNDDKLATTVSFNEDLITLNFLETGAIAATGSAVIYVTASTIIKGIKLRKDVRPWVDKQKDLALNAMMAGLIGTSLGAIGYTANVGINNLIGDFSIGGLEVFFDSMLAINGAFFAISLTSAGYTYIQLRKQGRTHNQAFAQFKALALTATVELMVFSTLGIGIEIGLDTLGDLALDALLPDPTGILIAAKMTYSIFKVGKKYVNGKKEKNAFEACISIHRNFAYRQALLNNTDVE